MTETIVERLHRRHGTLEQFSRACWNALGEISVREINKAIEKYRRELENARLLDKRREDQQR